MTMDKSLRTRAGMARARSVLTRAERIARLKTADKWEEGRSPLGLPKVRVYKLSMKKKKKRKEDEEGTEGAAGAAAPAAGGASAKGAAAKGAAKPAAKPAGKAGGK